MPSQPPLATGPRGGRSWAFTIMVAIICAVGAYGAWTFYGWTKLDDVAKAVIA